MSLIKVTERKLAANRANAQKSTGPRTPQGKAVTRLNALQHGLRSNQVILPELGESLDDFRAFHAALLADLNPPSIDHASLAEEFIVTFWKIRRARRLLTRHECEAAEKAAEQKQTAPNIDPHTALARELSQPGRRQYRYFRLSNQQIRLNNAAHRTLARFYNLPIVPSTPQNPNSQTFQPKSALLSTQPIAALLVIFAILLASLAPIANAAPIHSPNPNGQAFQPKSLLLSTPSSRPIVG